MGQKTSDFSAIPLCAAHHREYPDSYHRLGEDGFEHAHQIHLNALVGRAKLPQSICGDRLSSE